MSGLFVVGFPRWRSDEDRAAVQALRARHDPQHEAIAPHLSFVFGVPAAQRADCEAALASVPARAEPLSFVLRHALRSRGVDGASCAFLLPDEGLSALARLHDALYAGALRPLLRLDVDYIPHLTLARSADPAQIESLCAQWNALDRACAATLDELCLGEMADGRFRVLGRHPLVRA